MKKLFFIFTTFLAFQAIAQETNILQLKDVDRIKYFNNTTLIICAHGADAKIRKNRNR